MSSPGPLRPQEEPVETDEDLVARIEALDDAQRDRLRGTLDALLAQQRGRIEYAEGRRGALATTGAVAFAAGLAGVTASILLASVAFGSAALLDPDRFDDHEKRPAAAADR